MIEELVSEIFAWSYLTMVILLHRNNYSDHILQGKNET